VPVRRGLFVERIYVSVHHHWSFSKSGSLSMIWGN
jgi:hypothetical protein